MAPTRLLLPWACAALLLGCVLPEFEKAQNAMAKDSGDAGDAGQDTAAPSAPACGLSAQLPSACDACIREKCCAEAEACGEGTACGEDLLEPITPLADFSEDFDPMLACLQRSCDAECGVNWGCVDSYEWPNPRGMVDVDLRVVDFAGGDDDPIEGVTVQACDAVDPSCASGLKAEGVTDADGRAKLSLSGGFTGFYIFTGGSTPTASDYVAGTVQWSEPVHRFGGFTQYQLTQRAVSALAVYAGVHEKLDEPFVDGRGHLIVRIQSCLPMRYLNLPERPIAEAANVRLTFSPNDGATRVFYTSESGSVAIALEETSIDGVGGAFNVRPTSVTVTAVDTLTDREVARGNVQVNPGGIGFMWLVPRSK